MIAADQPTILPEPFFAATSSLADGVIRYPSLDAGAPDNIRTWCAALDVPLAHTVGIYVTYGDDRTYTDIVDVAAPLVEAGATTERGWIKADAFVTNISDIALILPVADCNAVVYADPVQKVIALAHLGWHSTVNDLASQVVRHMVQVYGTDPADILIYNSPSIRAESYIFTSLEQTPITHWHELPYATPLDDGSYMVDLVKYNYDQWIQAGIQPQNIEIVDVDTAASPDYPSARMGDASRFAVLAEIRSDTPNRY